MASSSSLGVFQLGFLVGPFGIGLADLFHVLKLFVKTHCQTLTS